MRESNVKIIIIILIMVMFLLLGGIAFLYITTDMFKSDEVLFKKYLAQNVQNIYDVVDISDEERIIDLLGKTDYTEKTKGSLTYLENQNDEQEVYKIIEAGIIKNSEEASYRKIKTSYGDTELVDVDLLQQDNIYGFRLANLVKQFVSVENATISYFVSSLGYEGKYFSEKLQGVDLSGLFNFTDEEIQTLTNKYTEVIFSDIDKNNYSSRSALITLNNGESVDTKAYTLSITKNELDKIYKRFLNNAISDEIILAKIGELDSKITQMGFVEPEEKSIKELYVSKLKAIIDELEYEGTDKTVINFSVYVANGKTIRNVIKVQDNEYVIDFDNIEGKTITLKSSEIVENSNEVKIYSLGKKKDEQGSKRIIKYDDSIKKFEFTINTIEQEDKINTIMNVDYSSDDIEKFNIETNTDMSFEVKNDIPVKFEEDNNILLNDFEGEKIEKLLNSLKKRAVKKLEENQSEINTKLLNNVILFIDKREQEKSEKETANIELQKQRFNNQFVLYEGQDVEYQYIKKLLKTASKNMSGYQIISGNQIRILVEKGAENEEKANEILTAISDKKTYNISIKYSDEGYVEAIDISIYNKK